MISNLEVNDWLKDHCRIVASGLVWPNGTVHSWDVSMRIVRAYKSLGLEPSTGAISIDLVQAIVHRLEVLEHMIKEMDRTFEACGSCAHIRHPGRQCGAQVPTAEGRTCRCMAGVTTAEANREIIKEGAAKVRVGTSDLSSADVERDLQTYLEGGTEEAMAAARRLDQRAVNDGRMSPAAFNAIWDELPDRTVHGHLMWCGLRSHTPEDCGNWGKV